MLAHLTKSLGSTNPANLPSRLPLCWRPPFANRTVRLVHESRSSPGRKRPDKDVLEKCKKIAAMKLEFERRGGLEVFTFHRIEQRSKEGARTKEEIRDGWLLIQLRREYQSLLREMSRGMGEGAVLNGRRGRLRFVSKVEALLKADEAQLRPFLRLQERRAVEDVLQAFLKSKTTIAEWLTIIFLLLSIFSGGVLLKHLYGLWQPPVDDSDFSEIQEPSSGVK